MSDLREEIYKIDGEANGGLSDKEWVKKYGNKKYADVILSLLSQRIMKMIPKDKSMEAIALQKTAFKQQLKYEEAIVAHANYNQALSEFQEILEELLGGKGR